MTVEQEFHRKKIHIYDGAKEPDYIPAYFKKYSTSVMANFTY